MISVCQCHLPLFQFIQHRDFCEIQLAVPEVPLNSGTQYEPFRDVALGIPVHVHRKSAEETHGLGSVKDPFTTAGAAPGCESELLACSVLVFIILI